MLNPVKAWREFQQEKREFMVRVQNFQDLVDATTGTLNVSRAAYRGNTYPGDNAMSAALTRAYQGQSDWGAQMARTCVDLRAAFIGGAGVHVGPAENVDEEASKEIEFIETLLRDNHMDGARTLEWATEGCIDGRALASLRAEDMTDPKTRKARKSVKVTYIPRSAISYTVKSDPKDYTKYISADISVENVPQTLKAEEFAYAKFGGRITDANIAPPLIGTILPQIENYDKALRDLREINNLYATPTPVIVLKDGTMVVPTYNRLTGSGEDAINWKIGKLLVMGDGSFQMVSADNAGAMSILTEMEVCIKTISAVTGIPPHFLGWPDLMGGRATADGITESLFAGTSKERNGWLSFYTDIFRKAIVMYNSVAGGNLDPNKIQAQLPEDAVTKMRQLVEIWLPLFEARVVSRRTTLERVPGVNTDLEVARVEKDLEEGKYDGVPLQEGNDLRGKKKPGTLSHDPDNVARKGAMERRTTGQGRNAR